MASLPTSAPPSHSIGVLRRPSAGVHAPSLISFAPPPLNSISHLHLRSKKEVVVRAKNRWTRVFASNLNPSDGSDDSKSSNAASGPPFLTIVAGVVVFLFVCWIIGSFAMWLVGLILHPPPLK